jgi:hypothetical protein
MIALMARRLAQPAQLSNTHLVHTFTDLEPCICRSGIFRRTQHANVAQLG